MGRQKEASLRTSERRELRVSRSCSGKPPAADELRDLVERRVRFALARFGLVLRRARIELFTPREVTCQLQAAQCGQTADRRARSESHRMLALGLAMSKASRSSRDVSNTDARWLRGPTSRPRTPTDRRVARVHLRLRARDRSRGQSNNSARAADRIASTPRLRRCGRLHGDHVVAFVNRGHFGNLDDVVALSYGLRDHGRDEHRAHPVRGESLEQRAVLRFRDQSPAWCFRIRAGAGEVYGAVCCLRAEDAIGAPSRLETHAAVSRRSSRARRE